MNEEDETVAREEPLVDMVELLEDVPPSSVRKVQLELRLFTSTLADYKFPAISLHCDNESCDGKRIFRATENTLRLSMMEWNNEYVTYRCSNCHENYKVFALSFIIPDSKSPATVYKVGEWPPFGPITPPKLIKLIGPDRDVFLKGRKCETQGLGIGAFAYYRRVVENQKNRILQEILKVCKTTTGNEEIVALFEDAIKETQFKKALDTVKDAIPPVLLINGHNPLTLLHSALSEGLHDESDDECLEHAQHIRIVLSELSEKLGNALKEDAELKAALSKLMQKKGQNNKP